MDDTEALLAARRHIDDALDALDDTDEQAAMTIIAAVLLNLARIAVNAALANRESKGGKTNPRA
jgi:hypothetical protein